MSGVVTCMTTVPRICMYIMLSVMYGVCLQ